jgi:hypothetical protein
LHGCTPSRAVHRAGLLLEGETHSRRDYVFIYTDNQLAATVKGRYKRDWRNATPGLSGAEFYDLYNDPREAIMQVPEWDNLDEAGALPNQRPAAELGV